MTMPFKEMSVAPALLFVIAAIRPVWSSSITQLSSQPDGVSAFAQRMLVNRGPGEVMSFLVDYLRGTVPT
jgi:hypothetical protein